MDCIKQPNLLHKGLFSASQSLLADLGGQTYKHASTQFWPKQFYKIKVPYLLDLCRTFKLYHTAVLYSKGFIIVSV